MNGTVPGSSIAVMVIMLLFSIAVPIGLMIYFRKKKKADWKPFLIGIAIMILFAFVLEQIVRSTVLGSPAGAKIMGSVWGSAIFGGLMAGIFEETGRFFAFRTVLRRNQDKDVNALMYGAGHGGIEMFLIFGFAMLNNLIYSLLINSNATSLLTGTLTGELRAQVEEVLRTLITTPAHQYLLGGVERVFAIVLQLSLSVIVWFAAKKKNRVWLFPVAIAIHFLVDAAAVAAAGLGAPALAVEALVGVLAAAAAVFAWFVWKREHVKPAEA